MSPIRHSPTRLLYTAQANKTNGNLHMKKILLALLAILSLHAGNAAADTNVLLIASTQPFGQVPGIPTYSKQDLVRLVGIRLRRELPVTGKLNVVFEQVHREKKMDVAVGGGGQNWPNQFQCHSLVQWYFWPEGREQRIANLTGKGEVRFDYVVLVGDPYLLAHMPGVYAEGVNLIANKVSEGNAKTVLLIPWGTRTNRPIKMMNEVVCRVAKGADLPVMPKVIAARTARQTQGPFKSENPFTMKDVNKRQVTYHHTGTSSERGIEGGLKRAAQACNIDMNKTQPQAGTKIDFNYGRANSTFEPDKRYKVNPKQYGRSYGFPMQDHSKTAAETMLLGIDRRRDDGTDLGIALDMIENNEVPQDIRCIPIRLMWAKLYELDPAMKPLRDRWHMSQYLDSATGAYMYTLLSGRCPIAEKPDEDNADATRHWLGQKVGYETAWRMNHLNARVPGFQVRPKSKTTELAANATSELEVKFHYPPTDNVTVTIAVDNPSAATVSPTTLTFTPDDYLAAQTVTVTGKDVDKDTPFRVTFTTQSEDEVYDALTDEWGYTATHVNE